jgi:hypothetical protein
MKVAGMLRRLCGFGRHLARDESGAALVYVSVALTVFMGFAALVIDGSRLFTLDTELQSAADAIALAGAAELDGSAGAIDRAEDAMANLVQNDQTFGAGGAAITDYEARFLDALPADDAEPITLDLVLDPEDADSDGAARFVEVRLVGEDRREINTLFAGSIGGGPTAAAGATAVAGFTSAVCKFTPLFMCNPYEGSGTSITDAVASRAERRKLIELKAGPSGGNASYFPGNFGLLMPDAGPGAANVRESLANVDPGACFERDGVELQTGTIASIRQAVNTRFDLYEGSFNKNQSQYRPAENVTKGYMPGNGNNVCKPLLDETKAMPLPLDDCSTGGCGTLGDNDSNHVWGNGNWDFDAYWDMNHGNRDGIANDSPPHSWSNGNLPTRYEVYRHEVETPAIPDQTLAGGEDGTPQCYTGGVDPNDDPDRRIIYAAVLNCGELAIKGGSTDSVPAEAFLKMFITRPMTHIPGNEDEDGSIFVEIVDVVKPGVDDEVVHDIVQLYR